MKKRIALAIALILALAMVFVLASCGGGNDEGCKGHTYSTEYTTDANGHWYEATCGCQGEVANYGAHKDEDKNGNCDVCQYVLCAHTFADTWSSDENTHYYQSTCACNPQKKDEAPHADSNKDGVCDVCEYVVCSHEYASEWSSDEVNHWKAPSCGCEIDAINLGAHADSNKDGNCDTCAYVMCAHTYEQTWSSDGAYHWHAATCGCNVTKDKAEHNGDEDDTACPTCGANICKHTYADTLSYDGTYHWYASTCGCDVIKDKAEHTWSEAWEKDGINHWHKTECGCDVISGEEEHSDSDDEDARCDKCGQIDFASLMDNIDEYIGDERNSIEVEANEHYPLEDYNYPSSSSIKVYDNYILITDSYGNKKYVSYCGQYNDVAFVVNVDVDNYVQREFDFDEASVLSFAGIFDIATGTTVEEYLVTLYTLGISEDASGFNYTCDEENSKYSFSYFYNAGYYYIQANVEFTLDEERMGVTSLVLDEKRYESELYVEGGENTVACIVSQSITQAFGDPYDSKDAPNPYPASKYIFEELVLFNEATGDRVTNGSVVTIAPGYSNGLTLIVGDELLEYAELNKYTVEAVGLEAGWFNYPISMYALTDGTYEVTVSSDLDKISFTVVVEYMAPSKIKPTVALDDEEKTVTSFEIYEGLEFILGAKPNNSYESPYISMPTVTSGDASKITFEKDGDRWIVRALAVGEYEITIASALDESVTSTLSLNVKAAPSAADILKGYYEIVDEYGDASGSIKFIPAEAGATNGTAIFKFVILGNPMFGAEDEIWEATASYAYENGEISLTVNEGSDLTGFALVINERYELMLVRTPYIDMPDYTIEYTYKPAKEIIIKDPTVGPSFTMNVVETYEYNEANAFEFVAGEAGKYVFYLPKGYGLMADSRELISYHDNKNGYEFTMNLKERQEVIFIPMATEVGEISVYFNLEKEQNATDANGLGGKYEFTFVMKFELTFTPDSHGATSGTLKVVDPANGNNSGTFAYTIVDGAYVFSEESGIYISKDPLDNWCFQNPSLLIPQVFSAPTSFEELVETGISYNGFKDENELGGVYTVTVDGVEYTITIVPSTDGGNAGVVQIYNASTNTYSEAVSYEIWSYEYFLDSEAIEIYRDTDGSWLVKSEGLNDVKFADATVIPEFENTELVIGSNTVKINPKDQVNGGKEYTITPAEKGEFTFTGASLTISVYNGDTLVGTGNKVVLEKDVTYKVVINTTGNAGEYSLDIKFVKYDDGSDKGEFDDDKV